MIKTLWLNLQEAYLIRTLSFYRKKITYKFVLDLVNILPEISNALQEITIPVD